MNEFITFAASKKVLIRALKMALIVGTILALINHYDGIVSGNLSPRRLFQIAITYLVPFSVSTISSALQKMEHIRSKGKMA